MSDNLFVLYRAHVVEALRRIVPELTDEAAARVEVTPTREAAHGDMATNGALLAAKPARRKPAEIAAELALALGGIEGIESAVPAGPGFVNITLKAATLAAVVPVILRAGAAYGDSAIGHGTTVNVEYVSANPTGPMHVGHCRGAVVGDALANLLGKTGYTVIKEYYVNDAGAQVVALAWAVYWRYLEALGTALTEAEYDALVPGGLQYRGDYLVPVAEALVQAHGPALANGDLTPASTPLWFDTVRSFALEWMMRMIAEDLAQLGVRHDVFTSERAILDGGVADTAIRHLDEAGLLYEGVLEPPKGKLMADWEARPQTLFRATQFGDDVDRPLRKSDGSNTYFANDIGYHGDKIARGADVVIDVLGADHGGYVPRMRAAVKAIAPLYGAGRSVSYEAVLCQIVHVIRNGEPVKMSKRAGTFVTLRDLLDEVGRDAVRFTMLTRKPDAQMEFDLDLAVAQTRDNPVFYVQYAHARCRSVLRAATDLLGAASVSPGSLASAPLESLADEAEIALMRRLSHWPRLLEGAALAREPHRIAFYLNDLAGDFHMLWNRGRDDATLRFLQPERLDETRAKLALVEATATAIRSGLSVLGVEPVEEIAMSPVDRDLVQEERIRQEAADRAAYRSMSHAAPRSGMDAGTKRLALFAGGLGALLVVVVGGWSLMGHHPTGIPVIEPPAGPIRVKPVDPGGMQVMGPQGPAPVEGAAQALAPGPEAPQPQALQAEVDAARHAAAPATAPVPTPASPDAKVSAPVPPAAASPPPPVKAAPASPPADTERTENVVPVPADPKPGVHAVQLAALESQSAAQAEWARLSRKAPSLFAHHTPAIAHVAHDGKSFYRLRTAGFDSSAAAASFCGQAKAQGIACTPAAF